MAISFRLPGQIYSNRKEEKGTIVSREENMHWLSSTWLLLHAEKQCVCVYLRVCQQEGED